MNIFYFNNLIYRGNIDRDFYLFCCKKDKKLYLYIFIHLFYSILSMFSNKMSLLKRKKYHKYITKVNNLDRYLNEFFKKYQKKLDLYYLSKIKNEDIIISSSPKMIVSKFLNQGILIGYELNENKELDIENYYENISSLNKEYKEIYYVRFSDLNKFKAKINFVCKKNLQIKFKPRKRIKQKYVVIFLTLILPLILLLISYTFTTVYLDKAFLLSYIKSPRLMLLNYLPILIVLLIFLFLTKRLWLSFGFTSLIIFLIGIVNKTKLYYRDDVLKFEDVTLFKEALIMTNRYDIIIRWYTVVCIILCILIVLCLKKFIKKITCKNKYNIGMVILLSIASVLLYVKVYSNQAVFDSIGDQSLINIWIATRQYQIRGLIYPFIHSISDIQNDIPENYDEDNVKQILSNYKYDNIDDNKKVNIIAIMLEAYNDFSKFKSIEFVDDIYKDLHDIQKKSLSGSIISNVIGGGTINTERNFLTGYYNFPSFRKPTYSYVTYFKEQGYKAEAMHPIYGAFYNRSLVDINLGFDYYYNYDNKYSAVSTTFLNDDTFFDYIIEGLEKANAEKMPYFNFSVTYQNHGPYSTVPTEWSYIKRKDYSDNAYYMFNRYLSGIKSTNMALKKIVSYVENYNQPTILIVFGDHNPYLGEANYVYEELGIDMSLNSPESFLNYYSIPYFIYGNEKAKNMFNKSFKGNLSTISPNFIMNELFEYIGLEGNEYLKYTSNIKSQMDVIHDVYHKENGNYILTAKSNLKDLKNEFDQVSYYYANKK